MSRAVIVALLIAGGLALLWRARLPNSESAAPFEPPSRLVEAAPLCPWRDPAADLPRFFPGATGTKVETRLLSAAVPELTAALRRPPRPEELVLTLHQAFRGDEVAGTILTSRAKGENGSIELVLALEPGGSIRQLALQRLREPESVARALLEAGWLSRFQGRTAESGWDTDDLAPLPAEARPSAAAIIEATRSLLVLLAHSTPNPHDHRPGHH